MNNLNQMHKSYFMMALFETNIVDWSSYYRVPQVFLKQLINKVYMIQNMDFVEQLGFYE